MIPYRYTFAWVCLFEGRCVMKLWEVLVSVILAPNLKFFTTFRSETLAIASVSWIGDCIQNRIIQKIFHPNMWGSPLDLIGKAFTISAYECTGSI